MSAPFEFIIRSATANGLLSYLLIKIHKFYTCRRVNLGSQIVFYYDPNQTPLKVLMMNEQGICSFGFYNFDQIISFLF